MFHLGDHDTDADRLERDFQTLPITAVCGNCDSWTDTPDTRVISLGGLRFFLCHGHTLGVKYGLLRAIYAAREQRADVLLFGHTHIAEKEEADGLMILNPGSCGYSMPPTYGYFILEEGKKPVWGLRALNG